MTTKTVEADDLRQLIEKEKIKRVILIDGERQMDRKAMRDLVTAHGVELNSPRAPLVVFKLGGNLVGCEDD